MSERWSACDERHNERESVADVDARKQPDSKDY